MRWRRRWPTVEDNPGEIKKISTSDLIYLMKVASEGPWSAVGRPQWVNEHQAKLERILVTAIGTEQPRAFRCLVAAWLADRTGSCFTLDIPEKMFHELRTISVLELVEVAREHLEELPALKLEPNQEQAWKDLRKPD